MKRLSYCAGQVRRHDRDRYLCALFAPAAAQEALFALYAFNVEVARIPALVSEPTLGLMRLQWWRDIIKGVLAQGRPPDHPVAASLAGAIRRHGLSGDHFETLLEGRARDLEATPPEDLDDLATHGAANSASLTALTLEVLGARDDVSRATGREVAVAWALSGTIRSVPFDARRNRVYLPKGLCVQEGLEVGDLFKPGPVAGLPGVIAALVARADRHLAAARAQRTNVAPGALPALLPAVLAAGQLKDIRRAGFDPFLLSQRPTGPLRLARLAYNAARGRY